MINSKQDLYEYLRQDGNLHHPSLLKGFGGSENYQIKLYFRELRYLEYYLNNKHKSIINKLLYYYYLCKHNRRRLKTNIYVSPNVFGPGINMVHPGFLRADEWVHIGNNCTVLPNVLFGKKSPDINPPDIYVGNDVYISTNVTILGPIRIGNNVTIGAGAVVNKDVPDNAVVAGVPAKIIKYNE